MAIQKKDYFTFLGGEVSPNLFKRVDMRAANKWFETAKNIFFDTTGGFFNRVGTEQVDSIGNHVKLLKFIYNKAQSYEVVFSQDDIKIYDNKTLLSTILLNIQIQNTADIIYTQIGDVMYICFGGYNRIYTLKRYANDNWVFSSFDYEEPPMLSVNSDKSNTLSFTKTSNSNTMIVDLPSGYKVTTSGSYSTSGDNFLYDPILSIKSSEESTPNIIYQYEGKISTIQFVENISDTISQYGYDVSLLSREQPILVSHPFNYYSKDYLIFSFNNSVVNRLYSISVTSLTPKGTASTSASNSTVSILFGQYGTTTKYLKIIYSNPSINTSSITGKNTEDTIDIQTAINNINNNFVSKYGENTYRLIYNFNENEQRLYLTTQVYLNGEWSTTNVTYSYISYITFEQRTYDSFYETGEFYEVSSSFDFFADKQEGDFFSIESLYSPSPDGTIGENKTVALTNVTSSYSYLYEDGFWSNGSWRLVTSGLFDGSLDLQYSYDGSNWYTHRSFTSSIRTQNNISYSTNYNEYGSLDVDDNVKLRLKVNLNSATNFAVTFDTDSFENRSYYKIIQKISNTSAVVSCIKYSVGTPSETYQWAESAWSDTEGYPAICFTYQNRLCFAKTNGNPFVVWTSKINDYGSFDTKIKYQDDDPITMDVVKFNGVSNIATVAALNKLFIFTEDAEYGIQDQGALTQANKSLIAFSKYGAEPLETQVSGNRIVFVEHGGKAARQLFYDFAQENYEAPDITVLYKHLLKNEKIIATDYIGLDYRTYLMLTSAGRVICYKYIPEQEITACSWFMHAKGTITNISALDVGNNTVRIYMAVDIGGRKQLEVMDLTNESYLDSRHTFTTDTATTTIDTTGHFDNGDEVCYFLNGIKYTKTIENNTLTLDEEIPADTELEVGYPYESEATLIPMSAIARNGSANYTKKNIFKANFEYFDSVAFKVGMKSYQEEFEEIKYEDCVIGSENTPHSGEKDDIIILSSYLDKNMLSFKQSEPYKMNISNLQVEVDYGG